MTKSRRMLMVALAIAATTSSVEAQGSRLVPALHEGDTLKVWATAPRLNGTRGVLAGLNADTLTLAGLPLTAPPVTIASVPFATLRRLEVQRGKHRSAGRIIAGTLLGAAAGGLLGAAIGPTIECANECTGDLGGLVGFVFGTGVGIAVGGVTGGILGARRVSKWENVTVGR